jgi:DNA-binding MarR family transcriptional regulator
MGSEVADEHLDAWRAVLRTHAAVIEEVERALAAADLPPLAWYDVLWALREAPSGRLRMGELAERVTISRGGLTKLVDRIEEAGLLERRPCRTDRRGFDAVLTRRGKAMLRRMWPVYAETLDRVFARELTPEQARAVAGGLAPIPSRASRPTAPARRARWAN